MKIGVFTVHKSASMLLHKLCCECSSLAALDYYSPNNKSDAGQRHSLPDKLVNNDPVLSDIYNNIQTGCVGPLRRPLEIVFDHAVIMVLRHPLDGLVSMYHSFTKIHGGIPDEVRAARISKGIDRCVIDFSEDYLERYRIYIDKYLNTKGVCFLKYEDMFEEPDLWIEKFIEPFSLAESAKRIVISLFNKEVDVSSAKPGTHKNQMTPGQYEAALSPATIRDLKHRFGDILTALNFE